MFNILPQVGESAETPAGRTVTVAAIVRETLTGAFVLTGEGDEVFVVNNRLPVAEPLVIFG